jgi:rhodanese-related sulfurtransferase
MFQELISRFMSPGAESPFRNIDSAEMQALMKEPNVVVLDVRTPEETRGGVIPGAKTLDMSSRDFTSALETLDKNATYVVYCRSGNRSQYACNTMASKGFKSLYNLKRGIMGWNGTLVRP